MAGFVELTVEQGAYFSTIINLSNYEGLALNLMGYSASSQLRKSYYSANSVTIATEFTDMANGQITMSMSSTVTANIIPGRYVFDLVTTNPDNVKMRIIEGTVDVTPSVTRS